MAQKGKREVGPRRKVTAVPIVKTILPMLCIVSFVYTALMPALSCAQETSSEERHDESEAGREMEFDEVEAEIDEDGATYYIGISATTTFEGADSFDDINIGDSVTVDYFNLNGNRTAENIVMEKRAYKKEEPAKLEKVLVD